MAPKYISSQNSEHKRVSIDVDQNSILVPAMTRDQNSIQQVIQHPLMMQPDLHLEEPHRRVYESS